MSILLNNLGQHISDKAGSKIDQFSVVFDELTLSTTPEHIVSLLTLLRDDEVFAFQTFISICGADYPQRTQRFDVVYQLLSMTKNHRVRIKLQTDEHVAVPSVTAVYPGALWFERETYDMYGVLFTGHEDMRRLLTDYGFEGHPLRKDFPLTGFTEVRYDDTEKRVVYEPVRLQQQMREFDFLSPWEGTDYIAPSAKEPAP